MSKKQSHLTSYKRSKRQSKTSSKVKESLFQEGVLKIHRDGYGFLLSETKEIPDVFIPARRMGGALSGDRARVKIHPDSRSGRPEGEIVEILKRGTEFVVGTLKKIKKKFYAEVALNARVLEFVIQPDHLHGAELGQAVGVKILKFPEGAEQGQGEVVKIFEHRGTEKTEVEILVLEHDLPQKFSEETMKEARAIQENPEIGLSEGRVDLRHLPFVTIDGENAKDFDDAVYVQKEATGYHLWVSIADVSHYVRPGTALDRDAFARGTSVYFPDFCLPMLPEELSNDVCSLRPHEDRLAFTCEILFNFEGIPLHSEVYLSLIRSHGRLTYRQLAQAILHQDTQARKPIEKLLPNLEQAFEFSRLLRKLRFDRGSIDFDLPEPEIILDLEEGITEKIVRAERNEAHFMIEEFMIAANEAVARIIEGRRWPGIYRVHEPPDPAKVESFHVLLHNLGFDLRFPKNPTPKFFNQVLKQIKNHPEEALIQHLLLRTMRQAIYSTDNLGHFGLASTCYTHFTSPIRRYPDLIVHRILRQILSRSHAPVEESFDGQKDQLSLIAAHCSQRERAAMEAEWEALALKAALFLKRFEGKIFEGLISRIAKFGFFVELQEYFVEGLVRLEFLADDFYVFDEKKYRLRGRKTGRIFKIGTPVRIKVKRVSIEEREILFELVD